jgi:hypothetical protein
LDERVVVEMEGSELGSAGPTELRPSQVVIGVVLTELEDGWMVEEGGALKEALAFEIKDCMVEGEGMGRGDCEAARKKDIQEEGDGVERSAGFEGVR